MPLRAQAGLTLIEIMIALAIVAILAGLTVPGLRGRELKMARLDGVQALTRVQSEQEALRANTGLYTDQLSALRGVQPLSAQGRYALSLERQGSDGYRATATARAEQLGDTECPALTLDVSMGFAHIGPKPACWGR